MVRAMAAPNGAPEVGSDLAGQECLGDPEEPGNSRTRRTVPRGRPRPAPTRTKPAAIEIQPTTTREVHRSPDVRWKNGQEQRIHEKQE